MGLGRESARYGKMADESAARLKELGDIQNWAEVLERELLVLECAVAEGEGGGGGEGKGKVKVKVKVEGEGGPGG